MQTIYPPVSGGLSRLSSLFPFSVSDCFIYGSILGLLGYLIFGIIKRHRLLLLLRRIAEYLVVVYIWFYLAWGITYFRYDFYHRTQTQRVTYSEERFQSFLNSYTEALNASYCEISDIDQQGIDEEVKRGYRQLTERFAISAPGDYLRAKPMLFSRLMSAVGVKGYMGPFFAEYTLNRQLLPIQYAATYAHEMSHLLGISNEAEANLCAYLVCTHSSQPQIRYSGYFSLLSYVIGNAYRLLPKEQYEQWRETLRPEIRAMYNEKNRYWQALYSDGIGEAQDKLYNLFLKSNQISSGTANYSQVIGLLIAFEES